MPAAFDKCVNSGGKVRTKTIGKNKYQHICILGDKTYAGYVKTKKKAVKKKRK